MCRSPCHGDDRVAVYVCDVLPRNVKAIANLGENGSIYLGVLPRLRKWAKFLYAIAHGTKQRTHPLLAYARACEASEGRGGREGIHGYLAQAHAHAQEAQAQAQELCAQPPPRLPPELRELPEDEWWCTTGIFTTFTRT